MILPKGKLDLTDEGWVWEGGPVALVRDDDLWRGDTGLSGHTISPGLVLQCGDYRVRVLRENIPDFRLFVVRDVWYAPFFVFGDKIARSARLTKYFLIKMAIIWGLGVYPGEGIIYDWDVIRPIRWMKGISLRLHARPKSEV